MKVIKRRIDPWMVLNTVCLWQLSLRSYGRAKQVSIVMPSLAWHLTTLILIANNFNKCQRHRNKSAYINTVTVMKKKIEKNLLH